MKQIIINIPDNCELKQDGNNYTIIKKEKKLTYNDIAEELFKNNSEIWFVDSAGKIRFCDGKDYYLNPNNCILKRQAEKLIAINKLMNVAKYLNGYWQPDWESDADSKSFIYICHYSSDVEIKISSAYQIKAGDIYFKSKELAEKAIEILGEDTIKLALCTDY